MNRARSRKNPDLALGPRELTDALRRDDSADDISFDEGGAEVVEKSQPSELIHATSGDTIVDLYPDPLRLQNAPDLLLPRKAMWLARCGKNRIYQAIQRGELAAVKIGPHGTRIPRLALEAWLSELGRTG
jgi:excisionase family DNA binding protein